MFAYVNKKVFVAIFFLFTSSILLFAQDDDMLKILDSVDATNKHETVIATFKESKIINLQTTETVKAKTMAFHISHLFGNIGTKSNGGIHTLYGLDNVSDVRFGLDFGVSDNLTLGIGRSKQAEMIDAFAKYRILTQTTDNYIPLSLAVYSDIGFNAQRSSVFYGGVNPSTNIEKTALHRLSYTTQLLIARKFSKRFSMLIAPTYQYRNFVVANVNPNNGAEDNNGLFATAIGIRFKVTSRVVLVADYFQVFSEYRTNNNAVAFYNPLAIGVEIETGGHVFHLNLSNTLGIVENNFIPRTTDNWLKGGFKFGFNISRVFNL
jgi:hypothetical protein